MPRPKSLASQLRTLPAQEFEHLTYDLLSLLGLKNLRWRTPGTDGGRDLEGEFSVLDFSGEHAQQKWYVECKRYAKSLDWPTVHQKAAIAINHRADFLLFVTTSNFSSACRDEVDRHNARGGLQIRVWPYFRLENLLSLHGQIALKYGLVRNKETIHFDFSAIILEITKLAQASYGAATFGANTFQHIELMAVLTELLSVRIADAREFNRFLVHNFKPERDSFDWCAPYPLMAHGFDETSLRSALTAIKMISGSPRIDCEISGNDITIRNVSKSDLIRSSALFAMIVTFGLIDVGYADSEIILTRRSIDGGQIGQIRS